jgi:heptosyltransferase-3
VWKRLEIAGKLVLARLAAMLLWRPGRRRRAQTRLTAPRKILLVRIDERVGEALLTTPLLTALRRLPGPPEVHVLVHPRVERVLRGHPGVDRLIPFGSRDRNLGPLSPRLRALRAERYDVVVNAANWEAPSVGPAIVSRLAAPGGAVVGPDVAGVRALFDVAVAPLPDTRSEARQRLFLLSAMGLPADEAPLSFRPVAKDEVVQAALASCAGRPLAVVNPGGRLGWRRVGPEVFAAAARELLEGGLVPLVTFGPGEEGLARAVVDAAPGAVMAPPTTIDQLAALMSQARLTICNNTGPMHLSVAVGTPTVGLFVHMDMARWGHGGGEHRMVDLTSAPAQERPAVAAAATRALVAQLDLSGKSP